MTPDHAAGRGSRPPTYPGGVARADYTPAPVARTHVLTAIATTFLASLTAASPAGAADATGSGVRDYPSRPIRMVNPYAPGGTVDLVARAVGIGITEAWGQQVIVDNRPGAGTNIGMEIVARAQPDGYTLLTNASVIAVNPALYPKLPFDPARDFVPIAHIAQTPNVLAVHPGVPAKTLKELVEHARANPGKLAFASSSPGGPTYLAQALFTSMAKIDVTSVPFKGGGPAIAATIGGQVHGIFNPPGGVMQHVKAGRLRAIALTGAKRSAIAPDLPTIAESGYPGYESTLWYGVFGPRGTPRPIVQAWNAEIERFLARPETRSRFLAVGMEPVGGPVEEFNRYFQQEIVRWGRFIKEAGIRIE